MVAVIPAADPAAIEHRIIPQLLVAPSLFTDTEEATDEECDDTSLASIAITFEIGTAAAAAAGNDVEDDGDDVEDTCVLVTGFNLPGVFNDFTAVIPDDVPLMTILLRKLLARGIEPSNETVVALNASSSSKNFCSRLKMFDGSK